MAVGMPAAFRAAEQVILPTQGDPADGILDRVVVDVDATVVNIAHQRRPAIQRILDSLAQRRAWR